MATDINFKVGDIVKQTDSCSGTIAGNKYKVVERPEDKINPLWIEEIEVDGNGRCYHEKDWVLIKEQTGMVRKFKVGDRVKMIGTHKSQMYGKFYTVYDSNGELTIKDNSFGVCVHPEDWKLVEREKNNTFGRSYTDAFDRSDHLTPDNKPLIIGKIKKQKTIMTKLNTMMKKLLDSDTQTLIKAGFIDGDLQLTEGGEVELATLVFMEKKEELVKLAQAQLDEAKKENK